MSSRGEHQVLAERLRSAVTGAWQRGWQPADLVRVTARSLGAEEVALVREAIGEELASYPPVSLDPRWAGQLAEHAIRVRRSASGPGKAVAPVTSGATWPPTVAHRLLSVLSALPPLERLGPLPGAARPARAGTGDRPAVDERVLARVRALLAKAESTTFPAEAETFTAGAQALMARHSLDLALLATCEAGADGPAGRRIGIDGPYEGPKVMLLCAVAEANRCTAVWNAGLGFCTTVGFPHDLDAVELLFTSLLVQATAAMTRCGQRRDASGRSRTRAFRRSFLSGYAARIGERLAAATGTQTAEAAARSPDRDLLPVLAARAHEVTGRVAELFPTVEYRTVRWGADAEGWSSGRTAADLASVCPAESLAP